MSALIREWGVSLIGAALLLLTGWLAYDAGLRKRDLERREMQFIQEAAPAPQADEIEEYYRRSFQNLMPVYLECKAELDRVREENQHLLEQLESE